MEDLYLGEDNPSDEAELYLGDIDTSEKETQEKEWSETDLSKPLPIDVVYKLLVENRPKVLKPKQFYTTTIDVYRVAGLEYFASPTNETINRLVKWTSLWIDEANTEWGRNNGEKLTELESALKNLYSFFNEYKEQEYGKAIWKNQLRTLNGILAEKCKDKILDISEIKELLESAKDLHLWNGELSKSRENILKYIKSHCEKVSCEIENYEKTFARIVLQKDSLEKLNTSRTINLLCQEYKHLKELNKEINGLSQDDTNRDVESLVLEILKKNKIELVDNYQFYKDSFFSKITKNYDLSYPIPSKLYTMLEQEAKTTYQFTEDQWHKLLVETRLERETDISAAFIMGTKSASSLSNIANMLKENKDLALQRIAEGDVETFFRHILKRDIASQIKAAKQEYKGETLLTRVCDIISNQTEINVADNFELAKEIESRYSEVIKDLESNSTPNFLLRIESLDNEEFSFETKNLISQYKTNDISAKECINRILLILQENYYVIGDSKLDNPKQILALHKKEKNITIQNLIERKSKVSIWINNRFPSIEQSIAKWRDDGNYTEAALKIALREGTSFYYNRKEVKSLQTLEEYILKDLHNFWSEYRNKKDFETSFLAYLNDYLGCSYIKLLMNLLSKVQIAEENDISEIIQFIDTELKSTNNFVIYTKVFFPIVNKLMFNFSLDQNVIGCINNTQEEMNKSFEEYKKENKENIIQEEKSEEEPKKKGFFSRFKK